jgi:hypothetical protein
MAARLEEPGGGHGEAQEGRLENRVAPSPHRHTDPLPPAAPPPARVARKEAAGRARGSSPSCLRRAGEGSSATGGGWPAAGWGRGGLPRRGPAGPGARGQSDHRAGVGAGAEADEHGTPPGGPRAASEDPAPEAPRRGRWEGGRGGVIEVESARRRGRAVGAAARGRAASGGEGPDGGSERTPRRPQGASRRSRGLFGRLPGARPKLSRNARVTSRRSPRRGRPRARSENARSRTAQVCTARDGGGRRATCPAAAGPRPQGAKRPQGRTPPPPLGPGGRYATERPGHLARPPGRGLPPAPRRPGPGPGRGRSKIGRAGGGRGSGRAGRRTRPQAGPQRTGRRPGRVRSGPARSPPALRSLQSSVTSPSAE